MIWSFICNCRLKHGAMEDGVNTLEGVRESESEGMGSSFGKDINRS